MARYWYVNTRALVAWQPRELAVLLSVCHDPASLDVPFVDGQWPGEHLRARNLAFRCLSRNQRDSYVAISLD